MKQTGLVGVVKGIMIQQIRKTYQEIKGAVPEELEKALKTASLVELQEAAGSLTALAQAEMAEELWKRFKEDLEKPREGAAGKLKETLLN